MTDSNFKIARKAMIDSQLRTSGVNEEYVLARMNAVPREEFLPDAVKPIAYMDRAVPLGDGQYLSAPIVHGMMLMEAAPKKDDNVLVVESGSSYFEELIRPLVAQTDIISASKLAKKSSGKKDHYSLIVIEGAIEVLPAGIAKQLQEGGRIVTGLVENGVTRLAYGRKIGGELSLHAIADVGIPILAEFQAEETWSF